MKLLQQFLKLRVKILSGIACYIGCEGAYQKDEPEAIVPFEKLANPNEWTRYSNETRGDVYDQAYVSIGKLILSKGKSIIEDILLGTKNLSFEAAFKKAVGLELEDYEKELEEDMKNGWKEYSKLIAEQHSKK